MRFVICFLGLLGSLVIGFFGWLWLMPANSRELNSLAKADYGVEVPAIVMPNFGEFETTTWAAVFLAVGGVLGLMGCCCTLIRRGRHGGVLMLLAAIGPAVFNPMTTIFSGLLAFAGLLSLFVRPLPPAVDTVE
jgi:hypothetical protein